MKAPKKLYAMIRDDGSVPNSPMFYSDAPFDEEHEGWEQIEYIRADLVPDDGGDIPYKYLRGFAENIVQQHIAGRPLLDTIHAMIRLMEEYPKPHQPEGEVCTQKK